MEYKKRRRIKTTTNFDFCKLIALNYLITKMCLIWLLLHFACSAQMHTKKERKRDLFPHLHYFL